MEFKQLEWEYFNPYKKENISTICAISRIKLPHWSNEKRDIKIMVEEREPRFESKCYVATLWAFNRGIGLVFIDEAYSVLDCVELCNVRLEEFASVFYNCR